MNRFRGVLFILSFVTAAGFVAGEVNWRHEPEGALREAREAERPALLFFTAPWCGYCRMMDNLTFRDEGVVEALSGFVPIKVDHDTYPMWVARYGVRGIPATFVVNERGRPVARADGFHDAKQFAGWLREAGGGIEAGEAVEVGRDPLEIFRKGLNERDASAREAALASALEACLGDDRLAAGAAETALREAVRKEPNAFLGLLDDARLAVRILATNLYRGHFGDDFRFDPWADSETREAYIETFFSERN